MVLVGLVRELAQEDKSPKLKTLNFFTNMAKKCKNCAYQEGTSYSFWEFDSPFVQSFNLVQAVKGIIWVTCSKCGQDWLMNRYGENNNTVDLDPLLKESRQVFDFWAKTALSPTQEQLTVLAKIVGLNGDAYGNGREFIDVPCKVTFKDGSEKDFCVVRFSQKFPIVNITEGNCMWITELANITPSPNALPYHVRYETSMAEELTYSYAPTLIQDPVGNVFGLNWLYHFFESTQYQGAQFELYEQPHEYYSSVPAEKTQGEAKPFEITYIFADWTKGIEEILLKTNPL